MNKKKIDITKTNTTYISLAGRPAITRLFSLYQRNSQESPRTLVEDSTEPTIRLTKFSWVNLSIRIETSGSSPMSRFSILHFPIANLKAGYKYIQCSTTCTCTTTKKTKMRIMTRRYGNLPQNYKYKFYAVKLLYSSQHDTVINVKLLWKWPRTLGHPKDPKRSDKIRAYQKMSGKIYSNNFESNEI